MKKVLNASPLLAMRRISMLVSASFKKGVLLVLTSFALSITVFAHTINSYTSNCSGASYTITAVVSSTDNTDNHHWQYKNASGVWVCLVNGANTIGSVTFMASGVTAVNTATPPVLSLTNLSASLDGVIFRLIIGHGVEPCSGGGTIYNNGTSSVNYTASGTTCQITPPPPNSCITCALGYPDNSNLPKSAVTFSENEVLRAMEPSPNNCGILEGGTIKLWYNDEHAMTLGVRSVVIKRANGTSYTTNYPITAYGGTPTCSSSLLFGTTATTGGQNGNDVAAGGGRPMRPVLYLTDLTVNGATSRIGDWQQGGTPYDPTTVCGSWKSAVRFVDSTQNPVLVTITPDADPTKNNWNLGTGEAPPAGTVDQGYGSLVKWDINSLGLLPGHVYRVQIMVHDGDQNKTGGDAGSMCATIYVPAVMNPDINVTYVNVPVPGNVQTNDKVPAGTSYGTPVPVAGNPASGTITMNSDGTYTFVSPNVGVYLYRVPVCVPGQSAPCPTTLLTITVLGPTITNNPPVANTDLAYTKVNTPVTLNSLANDRAGNPGGSLNPASVIVTIAPLHGTTTVNTATGAITYTPANNFVGTDTLTYRVCDNSTPTALCATAKQIITVKSTGAANSTLAADDYAYTPFNVAVSGNVKTNDTDPEGNTQTVTAQTTTTAGKGTLVLAADGSYTFTPVAGFTGPVNFPYTTCDNGTPQACASATLYVLVQPALDIRPDFNVTFVNVSVTGNVNTNDKVPTGTLYGTSPGLVSSPGGSAYTLTMNTNGTYTFTGNTVGVYIYTVPVCAPGVPSPCPNSLLTITVLGPNSNSNPPVANTDIATTKVNTPVSLNSLINDKAGNIGGLLNPNSVTVIVAPLHGTTTINTATGNITYTPANGYTGMDTLTYTVCDNSTPAPLCATAKQIISITNTPVNSTLAADDYFSTPINVAVSGNVKTNDTDPEGNAQTVAAQTTTVAGKGTLVLNTDGTFQFTPVTGFSGPVNFPYTTCDNGVPQACANATLYLLVVPARVVPDFTPSNDIDALSFTAQTATRDMVINISEVLNSSSTGQIVFNIRKISAFTITYNTTATSANVFGGSVVRNADWDFTENANFITCTLKAGKTVTGFNYSPVGITITLNAGIPVNTTQNITVTIITNTGGDSNSANNQAVTSITAN